MRSRQAGALCRDTAADFSAWLCCLTCPRSLGQEPWRDPQLTRSRHSDLRLDSYSHRWLKWRHRALPPHNQDGPGSLPAH